jgi:dolichol kinase
MTWTINVLNICLTFEIQCSSIFVIFIFHLKMFFCAFIDNRGLFVKKILLQASLLYFACLRSRKNKKLLLICITYMIKKFIIGLFDDSGGRQKLDQKWSCIRCRI